MLFRFKLVLNTLINGFLLLFLLCLGAQNLNTKASLDLGFDKTTKLPTGFLIGSSVVLGFICGGSTAAILIQRKEKEKI